MTPVCGNVWKYETPSGTTGILFNAGDGDNTKTGDMSAAHNHVYTQSGDQGSVAPASTVYILGKLGSDTSTHWKPNAGIALTKNGNTHTGIITIGGDVSGDSFSFSQTLSSSSTDWNTINGAHRYGAATGAGTITPGTPVEIAPYIVSDNPGVCSSFAVEAGTYYLTADFSAMQLTLETISVTLNRITAALNIGETVTLTAQTQPATMTGTEVTWETSDATIAAVSTSGKVTAVGKGAATITAHYGPASASCAVYVGKSKQTILWSQSFTNVRVNQSFNLTATATSALPVTYTMTAGTPSAKIEDGQLTALAPGVVSITASQEGDDNYAPADAVTKSFTVKLDYDEGDVNADGSITTADLTATIEHILGHKPEPFDSRAADLNGDSMINIADVALLVKLILAQESISGEGITPSTESIDMAASATELAVWWSNMGDYHSGQFEVTLPAGVQPIDVTVTGSNHLAACRSLSANKCRVALYSPDNSPLSGSGCVSIALTAPCNGEVTVSNMLIDSIEGERVTMRSVEPRTADVESGILGLPDIVAGRRGDTQVSIYAPDGTCVYRGPLAGFRSDGLCGVYLLQTPEGTSKLQLPL